MAVDLEFGALGAYTPPAGGAVLLVLGETEGASGTLTDSTLALALRVTVAASAAQLQPYPGPAARAAWGAANRSHAALPGALWGALGTRIAGRAALAWGTFTGTPSPRGRTLPWGVAGTGYRAAPAQAWGSAAPAPVARRAPWQAATPRQRGAGARWQAAGRSLRTLLAPWQRAGALPAVNRPLPAVPAGYGFTPGSTGPVHLHFCVDAAESSLDLVFGGEVCATRPRIPDGLLIAARTTYMHTHALTAHRLPDMTPLPVFGFELQSDDGSFGWTISVTGTTELLSLLAPSGAVPARLRVGLDGMSWDGVVLGLGRSREHGRTAATITARSASALLADPYMAEAAFLNAVPVTAQQIVEAALAYTGVSLDWQATDWLVPAGAWSFTGTPIGAVRRVADAIGAVVASPRTGDTITVRPRYPVLPWDWAATTPDITLALDVLTSEGYERADRPDYDGVYVSGQAQGVLALVKRTGTAPALLLPMVTDPLMTDLDAARQRGESMLGQSGAQALMTITLPVLTGTGEPGVIDPGKLVEIDDPAGAWTGLVRSVRVSAGQPVVRQTLTLERHL